MAFPIDFLLLRIFANKGLFYLSMFEITLSSPTGKLSHCLRVEKDDSGVVQIRLIDRSYIKALASQVRDILATDPDGKMEVKEFATLFQER